MSAFLKTVKWISITNPSDINDITDPVKISINKSTEIKNNICNITLKNSPTTLADDGSTIVGEYVSTSSHKILFNEEDELTVYALLSDNPSEFQGVTWQTTTNQLGRFILEEFQTETSENSSRISLRAIDSAYHLFNKVYTFTYGTTSQVFTSPGIVRHMCRKFTEASENTITSTEGTHNDTGTLYITDARFVSEGGYIKDYRTSADGAPTTTLNGALNNSATTINVDDTTNFESTGTLVIDSEHIYYTDITSTSFTGCTRAIDDTVAVSHTSGVTVYQGFPTIAITKIWKPIFVWVGEVSQAENTNYPDEIQEGGTIFYNRAFVFFIDEQNKPHFFYPDDTVDLTISLGEEGRRGFRLKKSVFDAVNFVIYNCGEDMYGNGIVHYWYDSSSKLGSPKMRYQPMTKIIHSLIDADLKINSTRDTTNQDIYKQFPDSGQYPLSSWGFKTESNNFRNYLGSAARTTLTNDTDYNDSLREASKWVGLVEAKKITERKSGLRYSGQIALKGVNLNPGDLIQDTNPFTGEKGLLLRVKDITHNITKNSWETTLDVEEDIKAA